MKNNSKARKEQRRERAKFNEVIRERRDCGHAHSENGAKACATGSSK